MDICAHVCCVLLYTRGQVGSAVNPRQGQLIITDPARGFHSQPRHSHLYTLHLSMS